MVDGAKHLNCNSLMVGATGLEPATSCLEGRSVAIFVRLLKLQRSKSCRNLLLLLDQLADCATLRSFTPILFLPPPQRIPQSQGTNSLPHPQTLRRVPSGLAPGGLWVSQV